MIVRITVIVAFSLLAVGVLSDNAALYDRPCCHANYKQGRPGKSGVMGPEGSIGPQGPRGVKGEKGSSGTPGPRGTDGLQGKTGDRGEVDYSKVQQMIDDAMARLIDENSSLRKRLSHLEKCQCRFDIPRPVPTIPHITIGPIFPRFPFFSSRKK